MDEMDIGRLCYTEHCKIRRKGVREICANTGLIHPSPIFTLVAIQYDSPMFYPPSTVQLSTWNSKLISVRSDGVTSSWERCHVNGMSRNTIAVYHRYIYTEALYNSLMIQWD